MQTVDLAELQMLLARGRYLAALREGEPILRDHSRNIEARVDAGLIATRAAGELGLYTAAMDCARTTLPLAKTVDRDR